MHLLSLRHVDVGEHTRIAYAPSHPCQGLSQVNTQALKTATISGVPLLFNRPGRAAWASEHGLWLEQLTVWLHIAACAFSTGASTSKQVL